MRFNPEDYVDVADRISRFWNEYPDGAIRTELASPASAFTEVVFRAEVYKHRDHPEPDAVGYAAEKPGNGANQTSWHENCETSAIGRALANMGYATSQKDRPSRQEMQKVQRQQQAPPPPAVPPEQQPIQRGRNPSALPPDALPVGNEPLMTGKQRGFLISLAKELGMVSDDGHHDAAALDAELMQFCGFKLEQLTVGLAKSAIEEFMARRDAVRANESAPPAPHPVVQQAIDSREANWIAAMEGAATMGELKRIGEEIAGAKLGSDSGANLRAAYEAQKARLHERSLVRN